MAATPGRRGDRARAGWSTTPGRRSPTTRRRSSTTPRRRSTARSTRSAAVAAPATRSKAFVYDPATDAWSALPNMPTARAKPSAAAVGGKIYVIGGWGAGRRPGRQRSTSSTRRPARGARCGATNPAPVAAAGTAVVDGKVYLVGGCTDSACTDTANTGHLRPGAGDVQRRRGVPAHVAWMSCGGIGGKVYCAGGSAAEASYTDGFGRTTRPPTVDAAADMPVDLWGSQYSAAGGLLVLAGGVTAGSTTVTNRTIGYDPAANAWRDLPNAQFARYRGAAPAGPTRSAARRRPSSAPRDRAARRSRALRRGARRAVAVGDAGHVHPRPGRVPGGDRDPDGDRCGRGGPARQLHRPSSGSGRTPRTRSSSVQTSR